MNDILDLLAQLGEATLLLSIVGIGYLFYLSITQGKKKDD